MASQPNKNYTPHVGRPAELAPGSIESLQPKAAAKAIAIHEGNRCMEEMTKAAFSDLVGDFFLKRVENMRNWNPIKAFVKFKEFQAEHVTEERQGKEHKENILLLAGRTRIMYEQKVAEERAQGAPDRDVVKYERMIQVLEYFEASNAGDATKLKLFRAKHPHITALVEKVILANTKEISKIMRKVMLEQVDFLPLVSPESAMELVRMAELQAVCSIFNKHPDVARGERIPLTKGGFTGAFELFKARWKHARENYSVWQEAKDFVTGYWKFATKGTFS